MKKVNRKEKTAEKEIFINLCEFCSDREHCTCGASLGEEEGVEVRFENLPPSSNYFVHTKIH